MTFPECLQNPSKFESFHITIKISWTVFQNTFQRTQLKFKTSELPKCNLLKSFQSIKRTLNLINASALCSIKSVCENEWNHSHLIDVFFADVWTLFMSNEIGIFHLSNASLCGMKCKCEIEKNERRILRRLRGGFDFWWIDGFIGN